MPCLPDLSKVAKKTRIESKTAVLVKRQTKTFTLKHWAFDAMVGSASRAARQLRRCLDVHVSVDSSGEALDLHSLNTVSMCLFHLTVTRHKFTRRTSMKTKSEPVNPYQFPMLSNPERHGSGGESVQNRYPSKPKQDTRASV